MKLDASRSDVGVPSNVKNDTRGHDDFYSQMVRRGLGSFYTPQTAARYLSTWAIRSAADVVLEPSFGGCELLNSSFHRLKELGCINPLMRLYGCDVDPVAFSHLESRFGGKGKKSHFLHADFLTLSPTYFDGQHFNCVVGNPPYVSHHRMHEQQQFSAKALLNSGAFTLNKTASLWAYFVLHSLSFLKESGRVAWVLPISVLYADYAKSVRAHIFQSFSSVRLIQIKERLFLAEGTPERSVLLLADGYSSKPQRNTRANIISADSLSDIVFAGGDVIKSVPMLRRSPRSTFLSSEGAKAFKKLSDLNNSFTVGHFAEVKIGLVTGKTNFFVIAKSTAERHQIPRRALRPILARISFASGLSISRSNLAAAERKGYRCLLVDTKKANRIAGHLTTYLKSFSEQSRKENITFRKRSVWHQVNDGSIPDAFVSNICHIYPRLVLNDVRTTCTNSIHRIYFKKGHSVIAQKVLALSWLTSYSCLSSEIEGRPMSDGALKLEPSDVRRIRLLMPTTVDPIEVELSFSKAETAVKCGDIAAAMSVADAFICKSLAIEGASSLLDAIRAELLKCIAERMRGPKKESKGKVALS